MNALKHVRFLSRAEWFIFVTLLVCYTYFLPRWADWNANSRMDLILAIVDHQTLQIDAYRENTGDYAEYQGHIYSDKAPGTSFLGVPVYFVFQALGGRVLVERASVWVAHSALVSTLTSNSRGLLLESLNFFVALVLVTFFTSAIPSALLGVVLYRFASVWAHSSNIALIVALGYGLATPAFAYANNLYGHQLSAFLLFTSFYLAYRAAAGVHPRLYATLVGVLLGAALITEYPTGLIVGAIGLYALVKWRSAKLIVLACLAGLPPLLLMMAYNYAIFSTPLPVGYLYSPLYTELHRTGFISLTYPRLETIFQLAFGVYRGLFLISPFLFIALLGFVWFARERSARTEFFVALWASASFWLFNSSSAMWQGGFGVGPRYLLPMLPFLALPFVFVLNHAHARWARLGIGIALAISFLVVWLLTLGGQQFPQYQAFPLFEYSIPQWLKGDIARNMGMALNLNDWASLFPLALLILGMTSVYVWRARLPETSVRVAARNAPTALRESH